MKLHIYGKIPEDVNLCFSINGESKVLSDDCSEISFDGLNEGEYDFSIEETPCKNNVTFKNIVIFILTIIIQGLFNVLLMNTDSKWQQNIKAYCIKSNGKIDLNGDAKLYISYTKSKYDFVNKNFIKPVLCIEPDLSINTEFNKNLSDFDNQYFKYAKKVLSVAFCCIAILSVLLCLAIFNKITAATVTVGVLIFAVVILVMIVLISQNRVLKNLKKKFVCN